MSLLIQIARKLRHPFRKVWGNFSLKRRVKKANSLKIVIGASSLYEPGWIPTDIDYFDILQEAHWQKFFLRNSLDRLLAEHVWEHLTPAQGLRGAQLCWEFLKPGGSLRVAVPDGYHPNDDYIQRVKVGGVGPGADDHKCLYNYKTFSALFLKTGFKVELLEFYDEEKNFHGKDWTLEGGKIIRSKRFDDRNRDGQLRYTSIILDASKS